MAPSYRLLDEEDQLGSLLDPQTLQSLAPTANEMAPSQQQQQPQIQMPQRDPQVDDAWRQLELQKIHEAQGGGGYGFAEGLRDTVPALLALGLDAGINHGRGAAGILQVSAGEAAAQEAQRRAARQQAGELAVKLHGRNDDPLAYLRAQTAMQNAGTNATRVGNSQQHWEAAGDPTNPNTQGRIKIKELGAGAQARGRITEEDVLNPTVAKDKAAIRTAETEAELAAKHEGAPMANADEADKARQVAEAKAPTEIAVKQTPGAEEQRQRELIASARTPIPGTEVANEAAWNAAVPDATRRAQIEQVVRALNQARSNVATMAQLRQQYGSKLRWDTLTDEEKRIALDRMNTAQQAAVGGLGELGKSGVVNAGEFPRYASTIPNGGLGLSDFTDEALGSLLGQSRDTQLEQLLGAQRQIDEASGVALQPYGIRFAGAGGNQAPASNRLPGEAVPADLGTTQGRVPPISAANNTVTVTLNGISRPYPREAALRMKQLDPRVEISN